MSTTTDEEVARKYATSKVPLVFKYEVVGLRAGVSIQWLSLYPKESEYSVSASDMHGIQEALRG